MSNKLKLPSHARLFLKLFGITGIVKKRGEQRSRCSLWQAKLHCNFGIVLADF